MEPEHVQQTNRSSFGIPVAIFFGFALIAAAIYFGGAPIGGDTDTSAVESAPEEQTAQTPDAADVPPVTEDDHIRGNPNAPIMLVEYSDYDCPFCKRFHDTMNRIMAEYGESGDVAWVYRHMPLQQLHPNAPEIAAAAECVGSLGGDEAFWNFTDEIFDNRGSNDPTNMVQLPTYAETAGVSPEAYNECVEEGRFTDRVDGQLQDALDAGARGTPHTFVMVGDQQAAINGAQPYENVRQIIENLLRQIGQS